ncbi:MAG TPA: helix-turn-helix domain-containing protein [Acidimicrobiia bacterium]|nr:helix-turn-helix domain-containing protein [Acidimicrobiia bacterium]
MEDLATPREVAAYLRVKEQTLRVWITRKKGPPHIKIEGATRYRWADVKAWIEERTVRS